MIRTIVALAGLAILFAVFAGYYYAPGNSQWREDGAPAYHLQPGDVKSTQIQPTVQGTPVIITLQVVGNPIDVYVIDRDWAAPLASGGTLDLQAPFSYRSEWSLLNVTGQQMITLISDGTTPYNLVFDNSDNHYDGDAVPEPGIVSIQMSTRFQEEESQSLVLGYIAAVPSLLLVGITVMRKVRRGGIGRPPRPKG